METIKEKRMPPHQFTSTDQPAREKRMGKRGKYLTPLLKKFLNKKINYQDPETHNIIRGTVKEAIVWRLILNGSEGETTAIKEIFDRLEGKLSSSDLDIGVGVNVTVMPVIKINSGKEARFEIGD